MSKRSPSSALGAGAQLLDLQFADHVGGRLAGIDDVAFDRLDDPALGVGAIVLDILDRLLAGPALVVEAGVDHQPDRAVELQLQTAEVAVGIGILPHLLAQFLRIKPPAFAIGAVAAELAERRDRRAKLGLERVLEVVAGKAFVAEQGFDLGRGHVVHIVEVDVIGPGP